jgi:hypothetical protein
VVLRRPLDAVLVLDKPSGMTSNGALQAVKRLYRARKAGHAGTLDPLASGVLPILFGEATKFASFVLDADKEYRATVKLGETTSTADAEGEVIERRKVDLADAEIEAALSRFRGEILQTPPMHSALKRDGRPLYELARAGLKVERAPRPGDTGSNRRSASRNWKGCKRRNAMPGWSPSTVRSRAWRGSTSTRRVQTASATARRSKPERRRPGSARCTAGGGSFWGWARSAGLEICGQSA